MVTRDEALANALDWAEGRRSWTDGPFTPEQVAVMDAQEVVKWSALAVALHHLTNGDSPSGAADLRAALLALREAYAGTDQTTEQAVAWVHAEALLALH